MQVPIGLSIGHEYCYVASCTSWPPHMINDEFCDMLIPAYISFAEDGVSIGAKAKERKARDPANTIYDLLDFIGRKYSDPGLAPQIDAHPFKVECGPDDTPLVIVTENGVVKRYDFTSLLALLLQHLKRCAENDVGHAVSKLVISVPTDCTEAQKLAIQQACKSVGLDPIKLVLEPLSALSFLQSDVPFTEEEELELVLDVGSRASRLTLLAVKEGEYEVRATASSTHLSGDVIDRRLSQYCQAELVRTTGVDISTNQRAQRRLLAACERAKRQLSSAPEVSIEVDMVADSVDLCIRMIRSHFEQIVAEVLGTCVPFIEETLAKWKVNKDRLTQILGLGGTLNIPKLQELLQSHFRMIVAISSRPEQALVCGCALQAAETMLGTSANKPHLSSESTDVGDPTKLPLTQLHWDLKTLENVAQLNIVQTYVNISRMPVEAVYTFNVGEEIAVTGFTIEANNQVLEGKIMERQRAEAKYVDALASGNSASLVSYEADKTGNIRIVLGNLFPRKSVRITLKLVQLLKAIEGVWCLTVPAALTPQCAGLQNKLCQWSLEGLIESRNRVLKCDCLSHPINVSANESLTRLALSLPSGTHPPDTDFVLRFMTEGMDRPSTIVQKAREFEHFATALTFCPFFPSDQGVIGPGEYIFVLDCSGSMAGTPIKLAKNALLQFIESIPEKSYFNVYLFGSHFRSFFPISQPYTKEAVASAKFFLENVAADMGGTVILPLLQAIFAQEPVSILPRSLFLLTDGAVDSIDENLKLIKEHKRATRVHTFGIGSGVTRDFIRDAARVGNGHAEFVTDLGSLGHKVLTQLKWVSRPALKIQKLAWPDGWEVLKSSLPTVAYSGEALTVFALCRKVKDGVVSIAGLNTVTGVQDTLTSEVHVEPVNEGTAVYQAAARQILDDYAMSLEEELHYATTYSVLSQHTSFFVVERKCIAATGAPATLRVPMRKHTQTQHSTSLRDIMLLDVLPLSIGVETAGGLMKVIIPRNTTKPCKKKVSVTVPCRDNGTAVVRVYEGERPFVEHNGLLGQFELQCGTLPLRSTQELDVTVDVDANGIINVTAEHFIVHISNRITIANDKGRLSRDEIERLLIDAEHFKAQDTQHATLIGIHNELELFYYKLTEYLQLEAKFPAAYAEELKTLKEFQTELHTLLELHFNVDPAKLQCVLDKKQVVILPLINKLFLVVPIPFPTVGPIREQNTVARFLPRVEDVD